MKKIIWALAILILTVSVFAKDEVIFSNAIFHWHSSSRLNKENLDKLYEVEYRVIFLKAGEFIWDSQTSTPYYKGFEINREFLELKPELERFQVHLVFLFEGWFKNSFLTAYFNPKYKTATEYVLKMVENQIKIFAYFEIPVSGIQMDVEGADVNFDKYEYLLDKINKKFGKEYLISITPMVGWAGRKDFRKLLKHTDFIVPMIYDYQNADKFGGSTRITDVAWIAETVKKYKELKEPFYAGVPTYSYRQYYSSYGKRRTTWGWVSPGDVSENETFKLVRSVKNQVKIDGNLEYNGDNIYEFEVMKDTTLDRYHLKKGSHIVFNVITPQGLKIYLDTVKKEEDNKFFLGPALFRYASDLEKNIIRTSTIHAIHKGVPVKPEPIIDILLVKKDKKNIVLNVILRNEGNSQTYLSENANEILMKIYNAKVVSAEKNNFDKIHFFSQNWKEDKYDFIDLIEEHVDEGEIVISGPIILEIEKLPVKILYHAWSKSMDGSTEGDLLGEWKTIIIE
ncbi:MAG TPA: hypothetical protein ENN73_05555 [Firmicutes bacterium]|nr:hypothetical protein [Bacillota bacterium]